MRSAGCNGRNLTFGQIQEALACNRSAITPSPQMTKTAFGVSRAASISTSRPCFAPNDPENRMIVSRGSTPRSRRILASPMVRAGGVWVEPVG